jgi:hypothetical protein
MGFSWGTADSQPYTPHFNYNQYAKPTNSLEATMYSNQEASELAFNTSSTFQPQGISRPRVNTSIRPVAAQRSTSFMAADHGSREVNEPHYGSFMMSPTSVISAHVATSAPGDLHQQRLREMSLENEAATSTSLAPESVIDDDEELLSPSDAAAAKNIEDEQGKIARSHPLYQAQPDDSGKYHCPNEGKPGCNHKPTPLKCNYE